ncbi:hypothetical protein GPALN_012774 [Globodera pallida]|nr:hypothetical protein GPALN_012774 [Globodera pallida]
MFSSPSSSLLASLFSSSPIFHPPPAIYSNSSAFIVPSSSSSSIASSSNAVSDAFRSLSLQLLLDQHRNSLLRSILALTTSTVPVDANNPYSTPTDDCQKTEFLLSNVEAEKAAAVEGSDGEKRREAENEELKKEKKREGRKRPRKERRLKDERNRKILRLHKGETETDSPVSGMFIREFCDEEELRQATAELDESAPFCNVTEETRTAISAIPDVIGDTVCALCKIRFGDVFRLAMHKCPRIRHEEYRCDECEKIFSCPANLASHRRWHRPRTTDVPAASCIATFSARERAKAETEQWKMQTDEATAKKPVELARGETAV